MWLELTDQGWRSLPRIVASGLALGLVMTLHTRTELIKFGAGAWIPEIQCLSFFVELALWSQPCWWPEGSAPEWEPRWLR